MSKLNVGFHWGPSDTSKQRDTDRAVAAQQTLDKSRAQTQFDLAVQLMDEQQKRAEYRMSPEFLKKMDDMVREAQRLTNQRMDDERDAKAAVWRRDNWKRVVERINVILGATSVLGELANRQDLQQQFMQQWETIRQQRLTADAQTDSMITQNAGLVEHNIANLGPIIASDPAMQSALAALAQTAGLTPPPAGQWALAPVAPTQVSIPAPAAAPPLSARTPYAAGQAAGEASVAALESAGRAVGRGVAQAGRAVQAATETGLGFQAGVFGGTNRGPAVDTETGMRSISGSWDEEPGGTRGTQTSPSANGKLYDAADRAVVTFAQRMLPSLFANERHARLMTKLLTGDDSVLEVDIPTIGEDEARVLSQSLFVLGKRLDAVAAEDPAERQRQVDNLAANKAPDGTQLDPTKKEDAAKLAGYRRNLALTDRLPGLTPEAARAARAALSRTSERVYTAVAALTNPTSTGVMARAAQVLPPYQRKLQELSAGYNILGSRGSIQDLGLAEAMAHEHAGVILDLVDQGLPAEKAVSYIEDAVRGTSPYMQKQIKLRMLQEIDRGVAYLGTVHPQAFGTKIGPALAETMKVKAQLAQKIEADDPSSVAKLGPMAHNTGLLATLASQATPDEAKQLFGVLTDEQGHHYLPEVRDANETTVLSPQVATVGGKAVYRGAQLSPDEDRVVVGFESSAAQWATLAQANTFVPPSPPTAASTGDDEPAFRRWYAAQVANLAAKGQTLNPNPDDPRQHYDYRGAWRAGATPTMTEHGDYRWPDQWKQPGHPVPPETQPAAPATVPAAAAAAVTPVETQRRAARAILSTTPNPEDELQTKLDTERAEALKQATPSMTALDEAWSARTQSLLEAIDRSALGPPHVGADNEKYVQSQVTAALGGKQAWKPTTPEAPSPVTMPSPMRQSAEGQPSGGLATASPLQPSMPSLAIQQFGETPRKPSLSPQVFG